MQNLPELLPEIVSVAQDAGAEIMKIYATDFDVNWKSDSSPVTAADEGAEAIILPKLRELTPDYTIVAEEAVAKDGVPDIGSAPFWLVDPLDGTREFLSRNGEFTVNIALVIDNEPKLGVIYVPAQDTTYTGLVGVGATRQIGDAAPEPISIRTPPEEGVTVLASRRHGDLKVLSTFLKDRPIAEIRNAGSSLKLCLVAAGEGDIYPRFGNTMEWDIAAGHAILSAAGGRITTEDREPMLYGKETMLNPHFIAWGGLE